MPAIRIIDDHLELANIGSNTHTQIDTHIAAADNYVKRDGSLALTSDWDIGDTRKIKADEIRARDGAGLKLYDDAGQGIFVEDGGQVGIGTILPVSTLHIKVDTGWQILESTGSGKDSAMRFKTNAGAQYWQYVMEGDAGGGTVGAQNNFGFLYNPDGGVVENVIVVFQPNGNVGFGTNAPTAKLDINSDILRLRTAKTPATAGAAGNAGDKCWDANYFYQCIATNSWHRTPHTWDNVKISAGSPSELTLDASGIITPTRTRHTIDTFGDAATDDLDYINTTNMSDGDMLYLTTANAGRDVTVRDNSIGGGNIYLEANTSFVMSGTQHLIGLMLVDVPVAGLRWLEITRFNG